MALAAWHLTYYKSIAATFPPIPVLAQHTLALILNSLCFPHDTLARTVVSVTSFMCQSTVFTTYAPCSMQFPTDSTAAESEVSVVSRRCMGTLGNRRPTNQRPYLCAH